MFPYQLYLNDCDATKKIGIYNLHIVHQGYLSTWWDGGAWRVP